MRIRPESRHVPLRLLGFAAVAFLAALLAGLACGGRTAPTAEPPAVSVSVAITPPEEWSEAEPAIALDLPVARPLPPVWAAPPLLKEGAPRPPEVTALTAVVIDEASEAVLFDKDGHQGLPPASLTKIATLIIALEQGDLDAWVEPDVDSSIMRGSTVMGLLPGDRFTLRDLLYGLMLPSGNDAALAIGRQIGGSDAQFVTLMNLLLSRLGLYDSHFANPHGLGSNNHYASAYDLAMLARYGMSLPGFNEIVTKPVWTAKGSRTITFGNINTFLYSYAGADGIKTGYTRRSGLTLVASATRNGHRLYAVVLNAPARDLDASRLLSWAFANHVWPQ